MWQIFKANIFLLLVTLISQSFFLFSTEGSSTVLVSVAPHKFFVEKIAGQTVEVQLMVPPGASSHTYEPSPRQMIAASQALIWFRIGEPFENRAIQAFESHHPEMEIIDLRQGLDLIHGEGCRCCPGSVDLHFWLSPKQGEIQAQTIAHALIKAFPRQADNYRENLQLFIKELRDIDQNIQMILAPLKNRKILVSHPAYAYFCRDYHLEQFSIEVEGKDPTPWQMTQLLQLARNNHLRTIFIQPQYNNKAAKLVAETLGAKLVELHPYSEDYLASLLEIAHAFANQ